MYIKMMGAEGLKLATQNAILNANYIAHKLKDHFPILYKGKNGNVAHECIIDIRKIKSEIGITEEDIAKRLIDFGFHAPTMSWPVPGTMMIEPTESESLSEINRFCEALVKIREEINKVKNKEFDKIEHYIDVGHIASYEDAIKYQEVKEKQLEGIDSYGNKLR